MLPELPPTEARSAAYQPTPPSSPTEVDVVSSEAPAVEASSEAPTEVESPSAWWSGAPDETEP